MTHPEILQCDRDVLARELEREGRLQIADEIRRGECKMGSVGAVLRALASVRGERPSGDAVEATRRAYRNVMDPDGNSGHPPLETSNERLNRAMSRAIAAADRARGRTALVWRTPEEWDRTPRGGPHAVLWLLCDDDTIFNRSSESPWPHDNPHVIAWAFPAPPPWAATPAETAIDFSRCGIQDGCENRARCRADGECHYTKSSLGGFASTRSRTASPPDPHRAAITAQFEILAALLMPAAYDMDAMTSRFNAAREKWERGNG